MKIYTHRKQFLTPKDLFIFAILFCLFLGSLNLINRFYYFVYIAAFLFLVMPNGKMRFDSGFFALILFSMTLLLFDPSYQTMVTSMIKPFTYPLCYLIGTSLFSAGVKEDNDLLRDEKRTAWIIYVAASGVLLHFILNRIINHGIDSRNVIDFWTRQEMSATGQATMACLMIAVAVAFLFSKVKKTKKVIAILLLLIILEYNIILAGRTIFALILIAVGIAFLYSIRENRNKRFFRRSIKLILIVAVIFGLLFAMYNSNIFGVKDAFESSNFYERFFGGRYAQDMEEDLRFENKLYYVEHFFDSMFGGGHIREDFGRSAHDLYLDTYDEAGIFALIFIVFYIVKSLGRAIRCARNKNLTFEIRLLILCVYVVVNVQFWLEPILRGVPWLLAMYALIDGAVARLLVRERESSAAKSVS